MGAPSGGEQREPKSEPQPPPEAPSPEKPVDEQPAAALTVIDRDGRIVFVFPEERWDLDIAAAVGKNDWDAVLLRTDPVSGQVRDRVMSDGAGFIAPLEFLSEVFIDGKPLSRPQFEEAATSHPDGTRTMPVHCPRFGRALLLDTNGKGRFITSEIATGAAILELLS